LTGLHTPQVRFKGPSKDVVDFYNPAHDLFFISDGLFRLIDEIDPGSLDHTEFHVRARDAELLFHTVMPRRVLEAVDPRRTRVVIKDEDYGGTYFRTVQFPDGVVFSNEVLDDVASFADIDLAGWYWSKELIERTQSSGMRGLYAQSVASSSGREIARF
jgi:hypothetical protein